MMGSPASEPERFDDETQHSVTLSDFYIGKYAVTQAQWRAVMGTTVRQQRDKADPESSMRGEGDNYPMYYVSWEETQEFIRRLNAATGKTYRLLTEAEWEYACRAGTTTPFHTGNNLTTSQANYNGNVPYNNNAKGTYLERTQPVGSYAPNAWGLYDMHGNVWEWCSDRYGDYNSNAVTNPQGPASGSNRVLRGGSWNSLARSCRSAYRHSYSPDFRDYYYGFRLASSL